MIFNFLKGKSKSQEGIDLSYVGNRLIYIFLFLKEQLSLRDFLFEGLKFKIYIYIYNRVSL